MPVAAVRSERGLFEGGHKRVERWRRIAQEASEQSRRLRMPEVDAPVKITQAVGDASTTGSGAMSGPARRRLWTRILPQPADSTALLIGPEGGWTDPERAQFATAGWRCVSLGPWC